MRKLRDYQVKAHQQIIELFKQKKRVLLVMPTGSGKSFTTTSFIEKNLKWFKFILMVKTRNLVFQLEKDLKAHNIDYAIFMAGEKKNFSKRVQLVSKDTLCAREEYPFLGEDNVVFITDEADECKEFQRKIIDIYESKSERFFYLGQTATPYNGLDFFDEYIQPISAKELNQRGILVDYIYEIPKAAITYEDVKISKGEWDKKDISRKVDSPNMIKECFRIWLEKGDNRQTLVFCSNKQHAINFTTYVNNYFNTEMAFFIFDKTPDNDRDKAVKAFNNGTLRFLVNIKIITRGVDIPCIGTILDIAPRLSLNLHIQVLGRGSRQNPFYKDCIVLDCVRNLQNIGHFYEEFPIDLKIPFKRTRKDIEENPTMRQCQNCFRGYFSTHDACPYCQFKAVKPVKKKLSKAQQDKLFLETATGEQIEQKKLIKEYKKVLWIKQNLGNVRYDFDIAQRKAHLQMLNKYGVDRILKVRRTIGLKEETIDLWKMTR